MISHFVACRHGGGGGSGKFYGSLAQLVEQLAFNQLVTGSNPVRPTIILVYLSLIHI